MEIFNIGKELFSAKFMDILEIIKNRRSIRKFQSREVEKEKIEKLIEALIWAPSAGR